MSAYCARPEGRRGLRGESVDYQQDPLAPTCIHIQVHIAQRMMMERVVGWVRWVISASVRSISALKRRNGNPPTAAHRPGIGTVRLPVAAASKGLSLSRS